MTGCYANPAHHEVELVRAFIVPSKRVRYLGMPAKPASRQKLIRQFAHFRDLDPRFAHRILSGKQTVDAIYSILLEKGALDTCYVMGMSDLDGQTVELREALDEIVGVSWGPFISCVPRQLGFFGGETAGERYILERRLADWQ